VHAHNLFILTRSFRCHSNYHYSIVYCVNHKAYGEVITSRQCERETKLGVRHV